MRLKSSLPHPIPYQGSKRNLAGDILKYYPKHFKTLYEPFAGSAAMTIATAGNLLGERYHISDLNKPLMDLWRKIIEEPEELCQEYERLWIEQQGDPKEFFLKTRNEFNQTFRPELFLYLMARVVKGAIRYNNKGDMNQSADNRRLGMKPHTMKEQVFGVSRLLKGKTSITSLNYREVLDMATADDLVYMDPPYQGVTNVPDARYFSGVEFDDFVEALDSLNKRNVPFIVSYDGRTGDRVFGKVLPPELNLELIELIAGRSSQATLLGRDDVTVESLYLSANLSSGIIKHKTVIKCKDEQLCFIGG